MKPKSSILVVGIIILSVIIWYLIKTNVYVRNYNPANVSRDSRSNSDQQMLLDSNGNPHIVWNYGNSEIYYIKWDGKEWVDDGGSFAYDYKTSLNISINSQASGIESFFLDSNDYPQVLWNEDTPIKKGNLIFRK